MADYAINYRAGSDNVITHSIKDIDLATAVTVTARIFTDRSPTETTAILTGITVSETGLGTSEIQIAPNSTFKALTAGVYSIEFLATDSGGDVEYTLPPVALNIVSLN